MEIKVVPKMKMVLPSETCVLLLAAGPTFCLPVSLVAIASVSVSVHPIYAEEN
jgi:hypothetical protein